MELRRLLPLVAAGLLAASAMTACVPDSGDAGLGTPAAGPPSAGPSSADPSAAGPATDRTPSAAPDGPTPVEHATLWLCRPGLTDNPCEGGLDSTAISADGDRSVQAFKPAKEPVADCFYVYPTVSAAGSRNAPLEVTDAEVFAVRAQAARFSQSCRVFAPIYRQITRSGLVTGGLTDPAARALAFGDVRAAFNDYLDTDNSGRPFVLIGHSQGAWMVEQLIQTEVDGSPTLRGRMLSGLIFGGTVTTAPERTTGGSFANVPTCGSDEESGCVVGYSSYAGTPPANGIFGRSTGGRAALCVSPAALLGRGDTLTSQVPTAALTGEEPRAEDAPTTDFVTFPGGVTGKCRSTDGFRWLDVTIDSEITDILPDLAISGGAWGLHGGDISLSLGDLVDLVSAQSAAWAQRGGPSTR